MLAFLLIVGQLIFQQRPLIGLVGDSLFSDRMRQDHAAAGISWRRSWGRCTPNGIWKAQQLLEAAGGEFGRTADVLLDQSARCS